MVLMILSNVGTVSHFRRIMLATDVHKDVLSELITDLNDNWNKTILSGS